MRTSVTDWGVMWPLLSLAQEFRSTICTFGNHKDRSHCQCFFKPLSGKRTKIPNVGFRRFGDKLVSRLGRCLSHRDEHRIVFAEVANEETELVAKAGWSIPQTI